MTAKSADSDEPERRGDATGEAPGRPLEDLVVMNTCHSIVTAANVDGASVTVMSSNGARELVYATDAVAQHLDDIQFTAGLGPCLDAFTSQAPVLCTDVLLPEYEQRWLDFTFDAAAAGVGSVFAFPLVAHPGPVFGVLEFYRSRVGELVDADYDSMREGAAAISHLVLAARLAEYHVEERGISVDGRSMAGESYDLARSQVNQAAGMVTVQLGVSIADALATLRSRAYLDHRPLTEIADDVVHRRIRFGGTDDPMPDDSRG